MHVAWVQGGYFRQENGLQLVGNGPPCIRPLKYILRMYDLCIRLAVSQPLVSYVPLSAPTMSMRANYVALLRAWVFVIEPHPGGAAMGK